MGFLTKEAVKNRLFSDAEVIAIRAAWANSSLSMRAFAAGYKHPSAAMNVLREVTYRYLLPGEKYRTEYDAGVGKTAEQMSFRTDDEF
jgi:hypothetical protein